MSTQASTGASLDDVFKKMKKFQERIGSKFFKNGDIARAEYNIRHNASKGEMAIYLYHVNGARMSIVFRTLDNPLSVLIELEQDGTEIFSITVDDKNIFNDWVCLQGELFYHHSMVLKNVAVLSSVSPERPNLSMFDYVRKFQIKYGRMIFENEEDIYKVEVEKEYDIQEGESLVRLFHRNGLRMSMTFCSKIESNHVRITVDRIAHNFEDWFGLQKTAILWNENKGGRNKNG